MGNSDVVEPFASRGPLSLATHDYSFKVGGGATPAPQHSSAAAEHQRHSLSAHLQNRIAFKYCCLASGLMHQFGVVAVDPRFEAAFDRGPESRCWISGGSLGDLWEMSGAPRCHIA